MNARQKKKQLTHKIISMNPGDVLVCQADLNKIDFGTACEWFSTYRNILPDNCGAALVPAELDLSVRGNDEYIEYLESVIKFLKESNNEEQRAC